MILAVMQPTYMPWIGYFDLIDSADRFVFLDDVKLEKSDWHVRNRVKSAQGALMLSQVVSTPNGRMDSIISETEFKVGHPWRKKHLKSIEMNYRQAPFFSEFFSELKHYYLNGSDNLADFNIGLIKFFLKRLEINTPIERTSHMLDIEGVKDIRLANLCAHYSAGIYLSPLGAKDYIEKHNPGGALGRAGVDVYYQNFKHPEYSQLYEPFISHLGVLDALMNLGSEQTKSIIKSGHRPPIHYKSFY